MQIATHVVLTGNPILVAAVNQVELPMSAQSIPSMSTLGSASKSLTEMILERMVSETRAPTSTLPANSQMEAMSMACRRVREREETEVAKLCGWWGGQSGKSHSEGKETHEFATSFAPMFQASRKANTMPVAKI
jgi:hypothetical protein